MKKGKITALTGNMVQVETDANVMQNEVAFIIHGKERLKSEVIRISGNIAFMQVFERTKGLKVGDEVEFSDELLSVELGPGLLTRIYDGLQNPLVDLAKDCGFFLKRGVEYAALDRKVKWEFTPLVKEGETVTGGTVLGWAPEGIFRHKIMVPFYLKGEYTVESIATKAEYTIVEKIARIKDQKGNARDLTMSFFWPVKIPITAYAEKRVPREPLVTNVRIIDTIIPIAKGGTFCVPGPFGAGKTVLQQIISRHAEIDIVIVAACGERAGEVVETLREFPHLNDPRTGKPLLERTIIIVNTSSMPVASREASVYTGTTLGEYYRQMGLNVLLLADSTSRWAQAMREVSGRLEEIPGEEAFPAYLESRIAEFYERSGLVTLYDGSTGSLTIGGTVSPAGGNFDEPVTQSTLKVVGAFLGLSRDRANARRFPSVHPIESWSKYESFIEQGAIDEAKRILVKGSEVHQMMMVVGEEGTAIEDFEVYLKSEFLDSVYLQQNGFDKVDAASNPERQKYVFAKVGRILGAAITLDKKGDLRDFFYKLRQSFIDWNYIEMGTEAFKKQEGVIDALLKENSR